VEAQRRTEGFFSGLARFARRHEEALDESRRVLAELFGTFALTLSAAGADVIASLSGEVNHVARTVAPGLVVMALIYALGENSGAHYNPVVTFAFVLRRVFPLRRLPGYWLGQLAGAVLAALLLYALFGTRGDLGMTTPKFGTTPALVLELVETCLLLVVILGTATQYQIIGPNAALAVGGTIALCGLFASPVSGASMNPARSLGPALIMGDLETAWIYLVGPFMGAALAVGLTCTWHLRRRSGEQKAATGDGKP
jgi:MIP family channel proteins